MNYSVYGGTGILGNYFLRMHDGHLVPREMLVPMGKQVLYLISTTSNFYDQPLIHTNTNIDSLMQRLTACQKAGVEEFNFVSSWFVYGDHTKPRKEDDYCQPHGLYSITKHCAERLVADFCSHHDIKWRILRLGNVYGGPDKSNGQRNALHYIIQQLKLGLPVKGVVGMQRDYIHIGDVCRAIAYVCEGAPSNDVYNIGTGKSVLLSSVIEDCLSIVQSSSEISYREHQKGEQSAFMGLDCCKLEALGFSPLLSLHEGLHDLCTNQRFSTLAPFSMATK